VGKGEWWQRTSLPGKHNPSPRNSKPDLSYRSRLSLESALAFRFFALFSGWSLRRLFGASRPRCRFLGTALRRFLCGLCRTACAAFARSAFLDCLLRPLADRANHSLRQRSGRSRCEIGHLISNRPSVVRLLFGIHGVLQSRGLHDFHVLNSSSVPKFHLLAREGRTFFSKGAERSQLFALFAIPASSSLLPNRRKRSSRLGLFPRWDARVRIMSYPSDFAASPLRRQAADALRRARKLPVGPDRNDLRQLAIGLLFLEKQRLKSSARIGVPTSEPPNGPALSPPGETLVS